MMKDTEDEDETPTGIIKISQEDNEKLSKEIEAKSKRISQKMKALRNRLANTEYRYINRSRRSRPE